ncbi:hypothetical protein Tco_1029623 [Tanacetum coccineum]|uniref:RNA-directed DNA polymerase, eukaryota n=1 Tax=Tanacetum coccineum TaxID=301880 RepID=A0ABQ5G3Y8_9ASTR
MEVFRLCEAADEDPEDDDRRSDDSDVDEDNESKPFAGRVKRELHDIESKDMDVVKEAERTREMGASFADISLDKGLRKNASPGTVSNSFAAVLKSGSFNHNTVTESSPAIVLNDECIMERDFSCSLMGKMKDINALSNLFIILANEGFENVKLFYLGGQWVLLELDSVTSKEKITNHVVNPKPSCNTVISEDLFGIYKILKRNKDANMTEGDTHTPQHPPGFTPNVEENVVDNIPGNTSQPKPNPTTSGNKEKASSVLGSLHLPNFCYIMSMLSHDLNPKEELWDFIHHLIDSWDGECVLLGKSLKSSIKHWLAEDNQKSNEHKRNIQNRLIILDKIFDQGSCNDDLIHERSNLLKELQDFNKSSSLDMAQKAKIRWAIEGE